MRILLDQAVYDRRNKGNVALLQSAFDVAWTSAKEKRPQLLQAAVRQIEWGRAGYRKLYDLAQEKNAARPNGSAAMLTRPKPAWATLE